MKIQNRVLVTLTAIFLSAFVATSCTKEKIERSADVTTSQLEQQLAVNPHFIYQRLLLQELLDQHYKKQLSSKNKAAQEQYFATITRLSSEASTPQLQERLVLMLGFSNMDSYVKWHNHLAQETTMLKESIPAFASLSSEKKQSIISNMIDKGKILTLRPNYAGTYTTDRVAGSDRGGDFPICMGGDCSGGGDVKSPYCADQLNACTQAADSFLYAATLACSVMSVPSVPAAGTGIFIGVACEALAIRNHYYTVLGCNAQYKLCK